MFTWFENRRNFQLWTFIDKLKKSLFVRNVLVVMTGTAVAQAIGFALSPVISRLFSPAEFGIYGSFDAVASIIATAVTLQYSQAIILPKEDSDAVNLLAVSCFCAILLSILCLFVCLIAPGFLNGLMKTTGVWALSLLVCATLVSGMNQSLGAWCVRVKAFKCTSTSQVVRSLSSSGAQLGCGFLKSGPIGLVGSSVFADTMASLNLGLTVLRDWRILRHNIGWQYMRRLALEYRDFPMYSATMGVMNALSLGLPMLLLTHFYGLGVAGAYAFAMRIISTPMGFILSALRQVLLQKAAEAHNEGRRLTKLYAKIILGLFTVALIPSLVLIFWAPSIFAWLFGAKWLQAGVFASSLIIWLFFMFCNLPAVLFGRIIRIQRQMFIFDVTLLFLRTTCLYFGCTYLSPSSTILIFSCVGGLMNIFFIGLVGYKLSKIELAKHGNIATGDFL